MGGISGYKWLHKWTEYMEFDETSGLEAVSSLPG